jgi:hypothetical protein
MNEMPAIVVSYKTNGRRIMMELIKWKKCPPASGPWVSLPYQALELTAHDDMSKAQAQAVVTGESLLVMVVLLLLHYKVQRVCLAVC